MSDLTGADDRELFDNSFKDWLEKHGVAVHNVLDEDGWRAHIEMNELKLGIVQLLAAEPPDRGMAKAYGGCTNCYGKGYATVKSQINGYGTDGDIGGYEGRFKQDLPVQMKFCGCERGSQLRGLITQPIEESYTPSDIQGHGSDLWPEKVLTKKPQ